MSLSPPATPAETTIVALARDKVTVYKEQVVPGVSRAVLRGHHYSQPGGHLVWAWSPRPDLQVLAPDAGH